jgi:hypothetical protein
LADRPKSPTQRGHESKATSYDTPSSLRRGRPAQGGHDGPKQMVDEADAATHIYDSTTLPKKPPAPAFNVKSMKTPGELSAGESMSATPRPGRLLPQVKLRAMSEVAPQPSTPQQALGFLAPPRNPVDARARETRDFIVWGSVCVILACVVALGIWFVAK